MRAAEHAFKRQAWHTWHAAKLTALAVNAPKALPSLAAFRGDKPAPRAPQTAEELLSIAMRWEAVGVGQVTRH